MKSKSVFLVIALLAIGLAVVSAQTSGGFTITDFPGYKAGEEQWQIFVNLDDDITSQYDLTGGGARGFGDVNNDGTVKWSSPPFSENDYTLYLVNSSGTLMKTTTTVTVAGGGNGTVNWSAFVVVK